MTDSRGIRIKARPLREAQLETVYQSLKNLCDAAVTPLHTQKFRAEAIQKGTGLNLETVRTCLLEMVRHERVVGEKASMTGVSAFHNVYYIKKEPVEN